MTCMFCGEHVAADDLLHQLRCDGRQGAVEALSDSPLYGGMGDVPFETGSSTSAAAADSLDGSDLAKLEALVYAVIRHKPRCCDAIEAVTGLAHQTASARIRGLVLRGLVVDSGQTETTRRGRRAVIWCITPPRDAAHSEGSTQ